MSIYFWHREAEHPTTNNCLCPHTHWHTAQWLPECTWRNWRHKQAFTHTHTHTLPVLCTNTLTREDLNLSSLHTQRPWNMKAECAWVCVWATPGPFNHPRTPRRDIMQGHYAGTLRRDTTQGHYAGTLRRDNRQGHHAGAVRRDITRGHHGGVPWRGTTTGSYGAALVSLDYCQG